MSEHERSGKAGAGAPHPAVDVDAPTRIVEEPPPSLEAAETRVDLDDEGDPAAGTPDAAVPEVDVDAETRVSDRSYRTPPAPPSPAPPASRIVPGAVLFGEYEIVEVLGAGGMGEVYKARHRRLREYRAIKMMHAELAGKKGANEFFLREAKALLAVRHPAVVHCHDLLSDEEGRIFLIMEMVDGISLADRMEQGPLSPDEVVILGARVAAGLTAAHKCGVVHRDVSPDNIVLPGGDVSQAKLIDFGIAKLLQEGQKTIVDGFKGKLSYASPEQLGFFGGKIDGRSDFYSLGLVLCAAALGKTMTMGTTVVEAVDARRQFHHVPEEIPIGLRSAIEPLLALDPADRPEYVERLFVVPGAEASSPLSAAPRTAARGRAAAAPGPSWRWLGLGAGSAALLAVAGVLLLRGDAVPTPATPTGGPAAVLPPRPPEPLPERPAPVPSKAPALVEVPAETAGEASEGPVQTLSALDRVRIVGLLRGAEAALEENRLQTPRGDNAYEKYQEVLALDPDNREARQGLLEVASRYLVLCERALSGGRVDEARGYLARASSIAPHHPRLESLRAAIADAARPPAG